MRAVFFDLDRALLRGPVEAAARRFLRSVSGKPPLPPLQEFRRRLRRQARALIAAHHWRGHVVVLLTDATEEWAEMAAVELDADGVLPDPDIIGRAAAVTRFCLRYIFDAASCFGYGAQQKDWLWLETLGHPAVAHPAGQLRRRARERGWPILNLNGRSQLSAPPAAGHGPPPPSAPPCVTLT